MAIKHPNTTEEIIDNFNEELHTAWINTMKQCFPKLIPKIESHQFRFEYYLQQQDNEIQAAQQNRSSDLSKIRESSKSEERDKFQEDEHELNSSTPPPAKRLRERRTTSSGNMNVNSNEKSNKVVR